MGDLRAAIDALDLAALGADLYGHVAEWYPWQRSITGEGLRRQLQAIGAHLPLTVHEVPSGTAVFDWTVPREWNLREAYIADSTGRRVVDVADHALHVMGYSVPVRARMPKATLAEHVFTDPGHPHRIPYRTSYYQERWAFCMAHAAWEALPDGEYEVVIDASLEDGALSYGECILPGETQEIFLVSAHACHPGLANDNCSGLAVAMRLAQLLSGVRRRYTYHFIFGPGTIGAITWLARNEARAQQVAHGLTLACVGDAGPFHYKQSRREEAAVDRAVAQTYLELGVPHGVLPFSPYGYDERQYCSPGFNLPVGCFMRAQPGGFPEYHSSDDNLDLVRPEALAEALRVLAEVVVRCEGNARYRNLNPKCEPQLGKRGLYDAIGGRSDAKGLQIAMLWVLNYSDGGHDLLAIAARSGLPWAQVRTAADKLLAAELLVEV